MDEHHGVGQQHHGGEEVDHDQVGIELGVDDDPAQHGLGQYAHHQATAQIDQVGSAGPAEDRPQERGGHGDGQDHRDQAISEFDQAVELQGGGQVARRSSRANRLQPSPNRSIGPPRR